MIEVDEIIWDCDIEGEITLLGGHKAMIRCGDVMLGYEVGGALVFIDFLARRQES